MSFEVIELSTFGGAPVELFEFQTDSEVRRYCTSDENVTFGGAVYDGTYPIKRTKIEASQDEGRSPIKVTASADLPFALNYVSNPPSSIATLSIKAYHQNDTDSQAVILWLGRVTNVKFDGDEAIVRCEPVFSSLKRPALRRMYQTSCPHVLYGTACKVNKTSLQLITTITTNDSQVITNASISGQPDGYYTGGFVMWDDNGKIARQTIKSHVGSVLTLLNPMFGLVTGKSITIFPGCDHALATCINKFNNVDNYGGFPYIPTKNPFGGNSIF